MEDTTATPVKRGRGRPPGSLNKPKPPLLSPEQAEALRRRLAAAYAETVARHALAADRKQRLRAMIKRHFGRDGFDGVERELQAAEVSLIPTTPSDADPGLLQPHAEQVVDAGL